MGMNFTDVLLAKVNQFDGERFSYIRKKTERKGETFVKFQVVWGILLYRVH